MFPLVRGSCMFWLWTTLIWHWSATDWISAMIALNAMIGITITTVILFKRVFVSDFIIHNGIITFRINQQQKNNYANNNEKD